MALISFSPSWFYGFDIVLELFFAIISIVVSVLGFKIYKKTSEKNILLFGYSFLFIGISYIIQSVINFLILSKLNEQICEAIKFHSIALFNNIGFITHVILMSIGVSILFYLTCKQEKKRVLFLIILFTLLGIFLSRNIFYTFYLFSSIFLILISGHFISNYFKNKKFRTLLIAVAFVFLLFGNFHFIISVNHQLFYVIGHILEFIAYVLILINYYLILKK